MAIKEFLWLRRFKKVINMITIHWPRTSLEGLRECTIYYVHKKDRNIIDLKDYKKLEEEQGDDFKEYDWTELIIPIYFAYQLQDLLYRWDKEDDRGKQF